MFTLYESENLLYNRLHQNLGGIAVNCMRCGRDTPGEQCFCEECLLDMESYPVKPGTVVQLPPRRMDVPARKAPRRKAAPLEDQVRILKQRVRTVSICLAICLLLLVLAVYGILHHTADKSFAIGQNYSAVTTPTVGSGN